ncbi:MAG: phosphotransferase [Deltaproteobacteria bacterium]|nr:phosphotransferase [Deltaproteobacteria bacterium]
MELQKLHGDASNRVYYRGKDTDGKSYVLMQLPEGNASVSEEITNLKKTGKELPFLNIGSYLKNCGLPVPEVYHYDEPSRQITLEDLGDLPLEKLLQQAGETEKMKWYQRAIDLLIRFQNCPRPLDNSCLLFERSFDARLYNWEFDHFLEYGIEERFSFKLKSDETDLFHQETKKITAALVELPLGPTHRDFQSRNLMVQGETLRLIDFQDALLGPAVYDLVALLRDSYISLAEENVQRLLDYYLERSTSPPSKNHLHFKKMFDWMTIQRKLKDVGRFIYIDRVKKNPNFLPFISPSLGYVRTALERQPELSSLFVLLKKYVPEFK